MGRPRRPLDAGGSLRPGVEGRTKTRNAGEIEAYLYRYIVQYLPSVAYPDNEKPKLAVLGSLFREWHLHFARAGSILEKHGADDMVFDGFYPHYFNQEKRVLFIGREARWLSGCNYINVLYPVYRETKRVGTQHLNRHKFHSRMIHIAYGIVNGMPPWQEIPYASEIGNTFGTAGGLSFAFMNISKLSNDSENWSSDWGAINAVHDLSTRDRSFTQEQVAILEPHVVITMNLKDKVASLGQVTPIHGSVGANSFWLESGGHRCLLIDTFHFSAPRKRAMADFYVPICDAIRRVDGGVG